MSTSPTSSSGISTLQQAVETALAEYFAQLGGIETTSLYDMVLSQVEPPLLQTVLQKTDGNQTKASEMLGINRGTLRKKLRQYNLI